MKNTILLFALFLSFFSDAFCQGGQPDLGLEFVSVKKGEGCNDLIFEVKIKTMLTNKPVDLGQDFTISVWDSKGFSPLTKLASVVVPASEMPSMLNAMNPSFPITIRCAISPDLIKLPNVALKLECPFQEKTMANNFAITASSSVKLLLASATPNLTLAVQKAQLVMGNPVQVTELLVDFSLTNSGQNTFQKSGIMVNLQMKGDCNSQVLATNFTKINVKECLAPGESVPFEGIRFIIDDLGVWHTRFSELKKGILFLGSDLPANKPCFDVSF